MIRPSSIPLGVYVPRRSPVHALPPTVKLVVLVGFVVLTSLAVTTWPRGLVALGTVVVRTVTTARRVADALAARGVGD